MPTADDARTPGVADGRRRRVIVESGGPILVEGPVEVVLPDGSTACSDRFMAAVCACRRSKRYPWCDTSHRRRVRVREGGDGPGASERSAE